MNALLNAPKLSLLPMLAAVLLSPVAGANGQSTDAAKANAPAAKTKHADIVYATTPDGMALKLDLFQPKDRKTPSPVVIVLHGTGMFTKGRAAVHPHAEALAGSGYVALAVGFRHESKYAYPAALDDVDAAVKWVHANAAKYNLDTNNIGVVGYSGGGSLATMLSAKKPPRVRAVVSYFAPSDLAVLHQNSPWPEYLLIKPSLEQWIGGTPAKVPMKYKQASPITHVHKEMAPHLLIAGTKDRIVPDEQSKLLAQEMKKLGAQVNLLTFENAPHNFDEEKGMNAKLAFQATEFFLAEHLMRGRIVVAQQQSGAGAESAKTK